MTTFHRFDILDRKKQMKNIFVVSASVGRAVIISGIFSPFMRVVRDTFHCAPFWPLSFSFPFSACYILHIDSKNSQGLCIEDRRPERTRFLGLLSWLSFVTERATRGQVSETLFYFSSGTCKFRRIAAIISIFFSFFVYRTVRWPQGWFVVEISLKTFF